MLSMSTQLELTAEKSKIWPLPLERHFTDL
jgi:hypothetical protein